MLKGAFPGASHHIGMIAFRQQQDDSSVVFGEVEKDSVEIDRVVPCFVAGVVKGDDLSAVLMGGLEADDVPTHD